MLELLPEWGVVPIFVLYRILWRLFFLKYVAGYDEYLAKQRQTSFVNIDYILERTNHEMIKDSNGFLIIVEKNKTATLAAQLVDDEVVNNENTPAI